MSYKVIIIDNKTNEVVINEDNAKAIIGAVAGEGDVCCIGTFSCEAGVVLETLRALDKSKGDILKVHPKLAIAYLLNGMKDLCDSDPIKKN